MQQGPTTRAPSAPLHPIARLLEPQFEAPFHPSSRDSSRVRQSQVLGHNAPHDNRGGYLCAAIVLTPALVYLGGPAT